MRNDLQAKISEQVSRSIVVNQAILNDQKTVMQIQYLVEACLAHLRAGCKVNFAGNGGSFADAQHLLAEFISRLIFDRAPLSSIALGTNNSALNAIRCDSGYDQVFSHELMGIGNSKDIFIPISTSGNSLNILSAVEKARGLKISTFCMMCQSGGRLISNVIACTSLRRRLHKFRGVISWLATFFGHWWKKNFMEGDEIE